MQILYVEDDKLLSKSVELMLQQEGHFCHSTRLGAQAIELAKRNRYDVIVLDVMLPDIDGFEVINRLRDEGVRTPFLIQTGLVDRSTADSALAVELEEVLIKPFEKDEFLERLEAVLARARARGAPRPVEPPPPCEPQGPEKRRHKRFKTIKAAEIIHEGRSVSCVILDISHGGAAIRLPRHFLDCPESFTLRLQSGRFHQCRICWRERDKIGVEFAVH
jgi:DNA-binding response OmpR family regulator